MKKVILFLSALLVAVSADAQLVSSTNKETLSDGRYNSTKGDLLDISGKVSTNKADNKEVVVPVYTEPKDNIISDAVSKYLAPKDNVSESSLVKKTASSRLKRLYIASVKPTVEDVHFGRDGAEIGYLAAAPLRKGNLFIDYGVVISAFSCDEEEEKGVYEFYYCNVKIPVSLAANLKLNNSISFRPYAGLNVGCGLLASYSGSGDDYNLNDDDTSSRFRFGIQYGFGITLSRLYLGLEWQQDITDIVPEAKCKSTLICVGLTF